MNLKEELVHDLSQYGINPAAYSIDDPKNYVLNFAQVPQGYAVWFQDDGSDYERKVYANLGQAVYEFVSRLTNTQIADALAEKYHDPTLKIYSR